MQGGSGKKGTCNRGLFALDFTEAHKHVPQFYGAFSLYGRFRLTLYHIQNPGTRKAISQPESGKQPQASYQRVKRNFYWIWFVGAAAWFFDAALSLHYHAVWTGLLEALVSAAFLAIGMYLKKHDFANSRRK